jgi:predicted RNase H-like HicB family nuclease
MPGSTLTFTVAVYEAEEGGYWAEVLELPGCASQGETLDQLKDNIIEAIEACLQAHLEDEGAHAPRKVITWTLPIPAPQLVST